MADNGKNGTPIKQGNRRGSNVADIIPFQFKPGQSGNPSGGIKRPRFENFAKIEDAQTAYDNLVAEMRERTPWAVMYYLDQFFGKPRQRAEVTGENGGPIEFDNARTELLDRISRIALAQEAGAGQETN